MFWDPMLFVVLVPANMFVVLVPANSLAPSVTTNPEIWSWLVDVFPELDAITVQSIETEQQRKSREVKREENPEVKRSDLWGDVGQNQPHRHELNRTRPAGVSPPTQGVVLWHLRKLPEEEKKPEAPPKKTVAMCLGWICHCREINRQTPSWNL